MSRLAGRRALVTGASSGIGAATAELLAREGADVALLARGGGRLIVLGSSVDAIPIARLSPYVAAKHALDGFLASLRAELREARSAVELSEVRPGAVDSPFWRHLTDPGPAPPRRPPVATYSTESVARAAVACAIEPRPVVTVGGLTLVLELAAAVARPLVERLLALAMADWIGKPVVAGGRAAAGNLWRASGDGATTGGVGGRPSLLAALRLRGSRPGPL